MFDCAWHWRWAGLLAAMFVSMAGCRQSEHRMGIGFDTADYPHQSVRMRVYGEEESGERYWVFEPDAPRPRSAPLIVFNHGWMNKTPRKYRAWIDHLVRQGNIVVYPRYQEGTFGDKDDFLALSAKAIVEAIHDLQTEPFRVRPDLNRVAYLAHSLGCLLSVSQTTTVGQYGLPLPKVMFNVQPGNTLVFDVERPADVPSGIVMVNVVGTADIIVGQNDARMLMLLTKNIPDDQKYMVRLHSDHHGKPPLVADHYAPLGVSAGSGDPLSKAFPVNAHDYGLWRMFDGVCEAVFAGKRFEIAPYLQLGHWPDGTAVEPMTLVDPAQP